MSVSTLKYLGLGGMGFFCGFLFCFVFFPRGEFVRLPLPTHIYCLGYQILSNLAPHPQIVPLLQYVKDCWRKKTGTYGFAEK